MLGSRIYRRPSVDGRNDGEARAGAEHLDPDDRVVDAPAGVAGLEWSERVRAPGPEARAAAARPVELPQHPCGQAFSRHVIAAVDEGLELRQIHAPPGVARRPMPNDGRPLKTHWPDRSAALPSAPVLPADRGAIAPTCR